MSLRTAQSGRLAAILGVLTLALAACSNASPAASTGGPATPAPHRFHSSPAAASLAVG